MLFLTNYLRGARTRKFITVFTRVRHRSISRANWIQSTLPEPISLRSILIPSSHLRFGLPSGPSMSLPYRGSWHSTCQISCPFSCAWVVPQNPSISEALVHTSQQICFTVGGGVIPPPNTQAGGPPPVGCPRLLIQYIRRYPPHLESVSSICNPRTRHAVVTRDPLNIENVSFCKF
jgi:hypothetical protein